MNTKNSTWVYILIFTAIIITWLIFQYVLSSAYPDISERALFGDSFGGLNTLFTGLAFAGVIISIVLQKNELELQRKELELTRKELSNSAEAQMLMSKSAEKQSIIQAKTARLNALNTMFSYWNRKPDSSMFPGTIEKSIENIYDKINKLYYEMEELENED